MAFVKRSVAISDATPLADAPRPDWSKQAREQGGGVQVNRCPHCGANLDLVPEGEEHVCKRR